MHLLARLVVATSVVFVLLAACSAPARAQSIPPWLPGLSVRILVKTIEFRDLWREEIRERLDRHPVNRPRPPIILPVIEPALEPAPQPARPPRVPHGEVLVP